MATGYSNLEMRKAKSERRSALDRRPDSIFHFRFSRFEFRSGNFFIRLAACVAAFAYPLAAYAQGCPLCYNTAAAAKASAIQALRSGILILIVPPLLICAGILWRGIKARDVFNEPERAIVEPERELAELLTKPAPEIWEQETGN